MSTATLGWRRTRWAARGAGALAAGLVVVVALGIAWTACSNSDHNICVVADWDSPSNPGRLFNCCPDPTIPECCSAPQRPTASGLPQCPTDGGSDGGDAGADGPPSTGADGGDAGAADGASTCAGQCVSLQPVGWSAAGLLWIGPASEDAGCPDVALKDAYDGYADLHWGPCGTCRCSPPSGSCGLPATLTASSTACPGTDPAAVHTPFDPPDGGWDGGCTANDAVASGQLCDGGPCVHSLVIAPLTPKEMGCATQQDPPAPATLDPPSWGTAARFCMGETPGSCASSGDQCAPSSAPGFLVCLYREGDNDCTDPLLVPYTEKHVFYDSYQGMPTCAPCACSPPSGSSCSAKVSIYADGACTSTALLDQVTVTSSGPTCVDVPSGSALGSKSADVPKYTAGACQASGGPDGGAKPFGPSTFCCIPNPWGPPTK